MTDNFPFVGLIFDLFFHDSDFGGELGEELAGYSIAVVGTVKGENADVAGVWGGDVADCYQGWTAASGEEAVRVICWAGMAME